MQAQTTKKLFAFITAMMFFGFTQFAFSQKCNANKPCQSGYKKWNGELF